MSRRARNRQKIIDKYGIEALGRQPFHAPRTVVEPPPVPAPSEGEDILSPAELSAVVAQIKRRGGWPKGRPRRPVNGPQ